MSPHQQVLATIVLGVYNEDEVLITDSLLNKIFSRSCTTKENFCAMFGIQCKKTFLHTRLFHAFSKAPTDDETDAGF